MNRAKGNVVRQVNYQVERMRKECICGQYEEETTRSYYRTRNNRVTMILSLSCTMPNLIQCVENLCQVS